MKKLVTIVGARPQFVKAAPVSRAIAKRGRLREIILHSGQHYDDEMSKVFFDELDIPIPEHNLGVAGGGHGQMTGRMLEGVESFLLQEKADAVLVYGDTNSTLAGALAAAKLHMPVIHVEAGLRSFNRDMPEETNRIVVDHVSNLLCAPTLSAVRQLQKEGFSNVLGDGELLEAPLGNIPVISRTAEPCIAWVGDVMFDALHMFREQAARDSQILERLGLRERSYVVVTVHRAENTADSETVSSLLQELAELSRRLPVVFPVHPRTRMIIERSALSFLSACPGLKLIPPLPYLDFLRLQDAAHAIVTDSGGVQKEAMFLGVPCITLRKETEWPETVSAGWNQLWGAHAEGLASAVESLMPPPAETMPVFGRGGAAETVAELAEILMGG